jgi:hypothetical protein
MRSFYPGVDTDRCNTGHPHAHGDAAALQIQVDGVTTSNRVTIAKRGSPYHNARHEKQAPKAGSLPVVTNIIKLVGKHCGTRMPQTAGNAKHSVAHDQRSAGTNNPIAGPAKNKGQGLDAKDTTDSSEQLA